MLAFAGAPFEALMRAERAITPERPLHPFDEQLRAELFADAPDVFVSVADTDRLTCGDCAHFKRGVGDFHPCTLRRLQVRRQELACSAFDARS